MGCGRRRKVPKEHHAIDAVDKTVNSTDGKENDNTVDR